jgi:hypothetical protein
MDPADAAPVEISLARNVWDRREITGRALVPFLAVLTASPSRRLTTHPASLTGESTPSVYAPRRKPRAMSVANAGDRRTPLVASDQICHEATACKNCDCTGGS